MDFSRFGYPSKEWLTFIEGEPSAARDGFVGNDPTNAETLRTLSNNVRGAVGAKLIIEAGLDQRVSITTLQIPSRNSHTIPLRVYKPMRSTGNGPKGAVLYFHGGGFLLGDETSDDFLCCRVAEETNTIVLSVIYRHTHKYKHPAQMEDALDAFEYVRDKAPSMDVCTSKGLAVMGISAGCSLAAAVVLKDLELYRTQPAYNRICVGVLFGIPWLIHIDNYPFHLFKSPEVSAKIQNKETPVIPFARLKLFSDLLGAKDPTDRLLNIPLVSDSELEDWPKTTFLVAGADPLRDDGLIFAKRLQSLE